MKNKIYTVGFGAAALLVLVAVGSYVYVTHAIQPSLVLASGDADTDENSADPQQLDAAVALAALAPKTHYQVSSTTPQFVLLSFDGSKSVDMLDETLAFEHKMQGEGKPLHFTYFINAAYFLTNDTASVYHAPAHAAGVSNIGFSNTAADIPLRVAAFNTAYAEGNEIGSHSVGHFDGSTWSYAEWKQEFDSFTSLMANVPQDNPTQQISAPTFLASIHGFRAPQLGVNANLYRVLSDERFVYDASDVAADRWPTKDAGGVWHIPLSVVYLGSDPRPVVAMDYNLWTRQSGAKNVDSAGTPQWEADKAEVENAYLAYFNRNYSGDRAPMVIGNHFSKWNDGVYWQAMQDFAEEVCGKPEVQCVTFSTLVEYLEATGTPAVVQ